MRLVLKELRLENFMMYHDETFSFSALTKIRGMNGKGKSSICNAYMWLMFNCDMELHDNPSIRRAVDGAPVDDMDVAVTAVFDMDGKEISAKKVQKRKYGKDGSSFSDTNSYLINDVPKTLRDFNAYFDVDMDTFKVCSNIGGFLAQKPADMREFLFGTVEDVTDLSIALQKPELAALVPLLEKYSREELEAMNKASVAKIKKDLPTLDGQIKEKERDVTAKADIDTAELELLRNELGKQIAANQEKQEDTRKQEAAWQELSDGVMELKFKQNELQNAANVENSRKRSEIQSQISSHEVRLKGVVSAVDIAKRDIRRTEDLILQDEARRKNQAALWKEAKDRTFDENSLVCAYCGQEYPAEKKEQLRADFERHKADELEKITSEGMRLKESIEQHKAELESLKKTLAENEESHRRTVLAIDDLRIQLNSIPFAVDISETDEYKAIAKEIAEKEAALQGESSARGIRQQLRAEEEELRQQLFEVVTKIASSDASADEERLEELREERLTAEQKQADAERVLDLIAQLDKAKNDSLTDAINSQFDSVRWKLWELNKSGGYKNVCIPTVAGKSILDITSNKGNRILGKIDICNSLQKISGINCPIFLDDCESLDSWNKKLVGEMVDCQVIMLIVDDSAELIVEA